MNYARPIDAEALVAPHPLSNNCDANHVSGDEFFKFLTVWFRPPSEPTSISLTPTITATNLERSGTRFFPAPNLWTRKQIGMRIEYCFWKKDNGATGIFVRPGFPVVYAPLVLYRDCSINLRGDGGVLPPAHSFSLSE